MLRSIIYKSRNLSSGASTKVISSCSYYYNLSYCAGIHSTKLPLVWINQRSYFTTTIVKRKEKENHETSPDKSTNPTHTESKSNTLLSTVKGVAHSTIEMLRNPRKTWIAVKDEIHHYYLGSKLLWKEMNITMKILRRILSGHLMTRRERMQLIRTTNDMFRLVPFAVFVIVPFMEFLLPFALKIFPNMLPSTFQDGLKKEENMKKELQMRLALASFLQDALKEMVDRKNVSSPDGSEKSGSKEIIDFIEKARLGHTLPNESVLRIAKLFKDELTLDNIARPQLVSMCEYMRIRPYGSDSFLRFQIRNKIRLIREVCNQQLQIL